MIQRTGWILMVFWLAASWIAMPSIPVCAQNTGAGQEKAPASPAPEAEQKKGTSVESIPVYKPPLRGSPGGRMGGGTRGAALEAPVSLSVLVPDHVGLTLQSQPRLYYFISKNTAHPLEFTITEKGAVKPILEARLNPPEKGGIQCLRLADHGVRLRHHVPYQWFVALVTDPPRRSKDILSGGMIEVISPSEALSERLRGEEKARQAFVLAQEGIWYDALAALADRIAESPGDFSLRKQRAALLEQVGLNEAAEFDLKEARQGQ